MTDYVDFILVSRMTKTRISLNNTTGLFVQTFLLQISEKQQDWANYKMEFTIATNDSE